MGTITKYQRLETVVIKLLVYNLSGTLVDPSDGCTITVVDPIGTSVVSEAAMSKTATGTYQYSWTSTATSVLGKYLATVYATDSSVVTTAKKEFNLEAKIGE